MAANTISTFTVYNPPCLTRPALEIHHLRTQIPCRMICNYSNYSVSSRTPISPIKANRIRAVSEEQPAAAEPESNVSVQVSPSDVLTMLFRAEGTMNESVTPSLYQALEGVEGIADLKVQVVEGIASVELTKQTTVQATGVASGLVETIQGSGFKLQTLNLSFLDEEDMS